jgi:hypothetical protein
MTDQTVIDEPKVDKPKRKYHRRANKVARPVVEKKPDEFSGLTQNDCPAVCNVEHCCISGKTYCGHPYKGGLRYGDMNDPVAVTQMGKAKRILAHKAVDKRLK